MICVSVNVEFMALVMVRLRVRVSLDIRFCVLIRNKVRFKVRV